MEVLTLNSSFNPSGAPNGLQQNQTSALPAPTIVNTGVLSKPVKAGLPQVPDYLHDWYNWAYLNPRSVQFLDHELIVATILWGNHNLLQRSAFAEIQPGQKVLQPACVYGNFSVALAQHIGAEGRLQISDVALIQVKRCRHKLRDFPQAAVRLADAAQPSGELYDAICCYFLLHEMPSDDRCRTVNALLGSIPPGGTATFIDYHKPCFAHPLKAVMNLIFRTLEPFAKDLWYEEIADFASAPGEFIWRKQTYFGELYQKVTAHRPKVG